MGVIADGRKPLSRHGNEVKRRFAWTAT